MPKTTSQISREEFVANAPRLSLSFRGQHVEIPEVVAAPREFSTGSLGWGASGKIEVMLDGKPVMVQLSVNMTVIGSKPAATKVQGYAPGETLPGVPIAGLPTQRR